MGITYDAPNKTITIVGYTEGTPCTFTDLYNADKAGSYALHTRTGVNATDGAGVAVDNALRPADYVVLGGSNGQDLYIVVTNWTDMTTATIRITGTDRDGQAQNDDVVVNANGTFYAAKWFKTVTHTQVTVFTSSDGGSFDYTLSQGQWGVVSKPSDVQFMLECKLQIGDGSTQTWMKDTNKMIFFAGVYEGQPGLYFKVKDKAHLTLGNNVDGEPRDGCFLSIEDLEFENPVTEDGCDFNLYPKYLA